MSELLPCPFCGSIRAELGTSQDAGVTKWSVICANCGSSCSLYCDSEHDAVELWNMRTPAQSSLPPLVDRAELVALLEDLASVNLSPEACSRQAARMADDLIARGITAVTSTERETPATLGGQIAAIYGELDAEDCNWIDREWIKWRGAGTIAFALSSTERGQS